MKLIIDTDKLKESCISLDEALYLLSLYKEQPINENTFISISNRGMVLTNKPPCANKHTLTRTGKKLVEKLFFGKEKGGSENSAERFEKLAEKLREIYPQGRKPGTNYMWRDSNTMIARKLRTMVKKYGSSFTDEEAINATKRYVESFNGNYMYMQLLKYFICKQRVVNGEIEESSQLMSFMENPDGFVADENWAVNLT